MARCDDPHPEVLDARVVEEVPDQESSGILARVEREVERIDAVIKDLLAYSRPGRGTMAEVAVAELVEDAMLLIRPQQKYKQVTFEIEVPEGLPAVRADPDRMRQVLG